MRTAFGKMGGALKDMTAEELGGIGIKGLIQKTRVHEKTHVDSVFLGSAAHCTRALNPARWASLYAGLPYETSASFVEMQCGSGIDAITLRTDQPYGAALGQFFETRERRRLRG